MSKFHHFKAEFLVGFWICCW